MKVCLSEFEFDIKPYLKSRNNVLLIRVRNDYSMLGGEGTPRRWGNENLLQVIVQGGMILRQAGPVVLQDMEFIRMYI